MKKQKAQAVIFYVDAKNQKHFLLLQMNKRRKEYWQNVTGSLDPGESFEEAAIREVLEETKIPLENIIRSHGPLLDFYFTDQWSNEVHEKVFAIQLKNRGEIEIDLSEHQDYKWVAQSEIHEKIVEYYSNYKSLLEVIEKC